MSPHEVSLDCDKSKESHIVVKWLVILLSIFQTRYFLTNRAMTWLVTFIGVLLKFLGRYSTEVAAIASTFPCSFSTFNNSIPGGSQYDQFERRAACVKCDSIYRFKEC